MNKKNKYNNAFVKQVDEKQLANRFNLSKEELEMIEKINKNPSSLMSDQSALAMMKKTADKVFKGMSKEEKAAFEKFKDLNGSKIIKESKIAEMDSNLKEVVFNDNDASNNSSSSDILNNKEDLSKKEKDKSWWKFW